MKIAAVQMKAECMNVEENLKMAKRLITDAFLDGAEWVIIPEFFTSGMAYLRGMRDVVRNINGKPMQMLKELAAKHNGVVGGSFIALRGSDSYNTFVLAFPDGTTYFHDKDQPSFWENCYYIGGDDDGVLETPAGNIGAAVCFEFARNRTAKRLLNRVDMVVGGSCWWTVPERWMPGFPKSLGVQTDQNGMESPSNIARMLGVHVIHAAHCGDFKGKTPLVPGYPWKSHLIGETQIVDGSGKILNRMGYKDGEGFIIEDIDPSKKWEPSKVIGDSLWIQKWPIQWKFLWWYQNLYSRIYYRKNTKRYWKKQKII
ncbi:MAG: carbon-nitrogen hydrolase family protein [archaeon]|nr:carbon-nitrogen hydrolase family protein [archaeon]